MQCPLVRGRRECIHCTALAWQATVTGCAELYLLHKHPSRLHYNLDVCILIIKTLLICILNYICQKKTHKTDNRGTKVPVYQTQGKFKKIYQSCKIKNSFTEFLDLHQKLIHCSYNNLFSTLFESNFGKSCWDALQFNKQTGWKRNLVDENSNTRPPS